MGLTVGYWGIRGLEFHFKLLNVSFSRCRIVELHGAPLRMMCHYAGEGFESKDYSSFEEWSTDKEEFKKKNPLINLPYVKDGDEVIVTQSNSCLQYLNARLGLQPKEAKGQVRDSQILMEVFDLRNNLIKIVYPFNGITSTEDDWKKSSASHYEKTIPTVYSKLEGCLELWATPFFAGDSPAAGDFHALEMIDQHEAMAKSLGIESPLTKYPKLTAYYNSFKADPKMKEYYASPQAKLSINNAAAGAWFA